MAAYYIDALLPDPANNWRWNDGSPLGTAVDLTFSFMTGVPDYYDPGEISGFSPFTAAQEEAARDVLDIYASIANITFAEVSDADAGGLIRFGDNDQGTGTSGYSYFPTLWFEIGGDVWINTQFTENYDELLPGEDGFDTLQHELGHALGLKHPGDYGGDDPPFLPAGEETQQYSVMSYNEHPGAMFGELVEESPGSFAYTWRYIYPDTPMLYDIAAIQYLYGANLTTRTGSTTYSFDPARPFFATIWDAGGNDTLSAANFAEGVVIDLVPGHFSSLTILSDPLPDWSSGPPPTYFGEDNLAIAFGTIIENATGGAGSDRLTGNDAANKLAGGAGSDTLDGGAGNDILTGGAGSDLLTGGTGKDTASYANATAAVSVSLTLAGAQSTGGAGSDTLAGIENLTGGNYADTLTGNSAANSLSGGGGSDSLNGGGGSDVLNGNAGIDILTGGAGVDYFVLANPTASDTIADFASGTDRMRIKMSAIRIGDGDTAVEGKVGLSGPGGFAPGAELVLVTADIAGAISSASAATAIGSATGTYAAGAKRLFVVDNGASSGLFLFTSSAADAVVSAAELTQLASLAGTPATALGDYVFIV